MLCTAQEERLRKQLAAGKFGNAAAMMRMAVNLALGTPPGAA
jgi:Arc/MetJ-type ribon-helix-helix transcriptional regulator